MRSIIPSLIVALKHLIKADQVNCNMLKTFYKYCCYQLSVFKGMDKSDLLNYWVCLCLYSAKPARPWRCLMSSWRVRCPSSSLMFLTSSASAWRWELNVWILSILPTVVFWISFWFQNWKIVFQSARRFIYENYNNTCSILMFVSGGLWYHTEWLFAGESTLLHFLPHQAEEQGKAIHQLL